MRHFPTHRQYKRDLEKERKGRLKPGEALEKRFVALKKKYLELTDEVGDHDGVSDVNAPEVRAHASGSWKQFAPRKVFVYGFCDYKTKQGALTREKRDSLATSFLNCIPCEPKSKFILGTKYNLTRRLPFVIEERREICWALREKLMDIISNGVVELAGKQLKVRVEDSPDRGAKRIHFFKAVDALKEQVSEEKYIIKPATCEIHDAQSLILLGAATEDEFVWKDKRAKSAYR